MNIKNLCVMALVAAATATTFSGCGGGGESNGSAGYVSASKFAAGAVTIYSINSRSLQITPERKLDGSGKWKPSITIAPSSTTDADGLTYETTDSAYCYGHVGVLGGQQYEANLLYLVSGDEVGCIQPVFLSTDTTDNLHLMNACGFVTADNLVSDYDNVTLWIDTNRIVGSDLDSVQLQILLNFKTQKMTIITSATGFTVTYKDSDNDTTLTKTLDITLRQSSVSCPYIVEPR